MYTKIKILHLSRLDRSIFLRLCTLFFITIASVAILRSKGLDSLGEPFGGPADFPIHAFLLLGFLLLIFAFLIRKQQKSQMALGWPSLSHVIAGSTLLSFALGIAYRLTHLSGYNFGYIVRFVLEHGQTGESLVGSVMDGVLLFTVVPLLLLLLPDRLVRKNAGAIMIGLAILASFLFLRTIENAYYPLAGPIIIRCVQSILEILPGQTSGDLGRWQLEYSGFIVNIGPSCTEISSMLLFILVFSFVWVKVGAQEFVSNTYAMGMLALSLPILWLINIMRIILLMIIGSIYPAFAVGLFHNGIGMLLFFVFFLYYIKITLRVIRRPSLHVHPLQEIMQCSSDVMRRQQQERV